MASNHIIPLQPLPAGKWFRSFSLDLQHAGIALLPPEHELIVNVETGHYLVLNWDVRYPCTDGMFSKAELPLVLALLGSWPSYIQNEKLLQLVTRQPVEEIADLIELAPDETLEPLHSLVDRCRLHFHKFGIEIQDTSGQGYKLSRYIAGRGERQS
jgi:hypothetical protein